MERFLTKITSGRWILTVIGGGVFCYVSITGMLDKQAVASILTAIFMSYFNKRGGEYEDTTNSINGDVNK